MIAPRLAALAVLSLVSVSPAAAQPSAMTIYLSNYNYAPTPIYLRAGRPVTLTFVNRSGGGHDFTARSFFANSRIMSGMVMDGMVELRGREAKRVTLVPRRGTYDVHCTHFMHSFFGMKDRIIVN